MWTPVQSCCSSASPTACRDGAGNRRLDERSPSEHIVVVALLSIAAARSGQPSNPPRSSWFLSERQRRLASGSLPATSLGGMAGEMKIQIADRFPLALTVVDASVSGLLTAYSGQRPPQSRY